jgi:hypothetical protein
MAMTLDEELTKSTQDLGSKIDKTVLRIEQDGNVKERRSKRQRQWDLILRVTTAILAVIAPALVTYSTTSPSEYFKLAAIILSGLAGVGATIQTILALQQNYVRNAVDALDLVDLKAQLEIDRDTALKMKFTEQNAALAVALNTATKKHRDIIIGRQKAYVEQDLPKTG